MSKNRIKCKCGSIVGKYYYEKHLKTYKHKLFIKNKKKAKNKIKCRCGSIVGDYYYEKHLQTYKHKLFIKNEKKAKNRIKCRCGSVVGNYYYEKHLQTYKHKLFIKNKKKSHTATINMVTNKIKKQTKKGEDIIPNSFSTDFYYILPTKYNKIFEKYNDDYYNLVKRYNNLKNVYDTAIKKHNRIVTNKTIERYNSQITKINVIKKWMQNGRYNSIKDNINQNIKTLKKFGKFYIGITSNCENRAKGTDHFQKNLENMIVLWKTKSLSKVCQAEDDMIDLHYDDKNCMNIAQYGGGGNIPKNCPNYYLYILTNYDA